MIIYKKNTDVNVILFYDVSDTDDKERYSMIRKHQYLIYCLVRMQILWRVTHLTFVNSAFFMYHIIECRIV